jgi:hypothetical protein
MTRDKVIRGAVMALAFVAIATCKEATDNRPVAGWLDVRLVSPNIDDGGVSITISGAEIDSVRTTFPLFAQEVVNDTTRKLVVGGNVGTGTVAQIWVPDTRHASLYTGTLLEVAVRTTYTQRATTGYAVVVASP